ncbi:hypothetical protein JCM10207_003938 [Rhodosporidiobolus poonsookiae]
MQQLYDYSPDDGDHPHPSPSDGLVNPAYLASTSVGPTYPSYPSYSHADSWTSPVPYPIPSDAYSAPVQHPPPHLAAPNPSPFADYTPYVLPPQQTFHYAPAGPPDHSLALDSAVLSSRWTAGDVPAPASDPSTSAFPLPFYSSSAPAAVMPGLSVAQAVRAFAPNAGGGLGPLPAGTLAARRGSTGGFEADAIIDGPTGLSPRVKPFISKLFHLVSHPESYADCITWDTEGKTFIVHSCKRFTGEVLQRMFGHTNLASFTRQLNVYGFRRISGTELAARIDVQDTANYSGWQHDQFVRGDRGALPLLSPRPSRARMLKKAEKAQREDRSAGRGDEQDGVIGDEPSPTYLSEERRASHASTVSTQSEEPFDQRDGIDGFGEHNGRDGRAYLHQHGEQDTNTLGLVWGS